MPIQKAQFHRLSRIVALLKENRYPNSKTLQKEFQRMELEEELPVECSRKTILRDLETLEKEFKCPLAFDRGRNGYFLKHHGWDFIAPALLDENEMLASVIGARISEKILPPPLKNKIREAVDFLLQNNNPDFLDTANMESLSIISGLYINIDPDIFMTVFIAWQSHRCIQINYSDYSGSVSSRVFEPHTLVFYNNSWYSKGLCRLKQEIRTFALHRIMEAELLEEGFIPDKKVIQSINSDEFLGFQKLKNVKIRIADALRDGLAAHPLHSGQEIHEDNTVDIPAVSREVLFPYLLSQQGQAELLAPEELRIELKNILRKMLETY